MKEITASDCDRNAPEDGGRKKIISLQDIILNTNPHQFSFESYSSGRYVCPDSNPRTSPLSPVSSRLCVRVCVCGTLISCRSSLRQLSSTSTSTSQFATCLPSLFVRRYINSDVILNAQHARY